MLQLRALLLKGFAVRRISLNHLALAALAAFAAPCWPLEAANVLTFHNDNSRTGRNLQETILNTLNVNPNTFGKLFSVSLDGNSFGQPLYVASVNFKGGDRSVVYVATSHDSVYAIDARTGAIIWRVNLGNPVPRHDVETFRQAHMPDGSPYYDIYPEIGITSTPVIDIGSQAIFVVAKTRVSVEDKPKYVYSLHALDLRDGSEKSDGPVIIDGHVPSARGSAADAADVSFDPFLALNRAALLLLNDRVYLAFSSQGDIEDSPSRPFHGWIFSFPESHLRDRPWVFCTSPTSSRAGIWQSGGGLAADPDDHLLAVTGNGPNVAGSYGNSLLNFSTKRGLELQDWFTPDNSDFLNDWDLDFGSAGPVIVPAEDFKDLVVSGGKDGMLYLLHRSSLGHGRTAIGVKGAQAVRITPKPEPRPEPPAYHGRPLYNGPDDWHHLHGTPVYWNGPEGPTLYLWPEMGKLKAISIRHSQLATTVESKTSAAEGMPGAALSLSAHGSQPASGVLWASRPLNADANRRNVEGILEAYDAAHIAGAEPIWTNRQNLERDGGGFFAKFSPPTVADGRVFLSTFAPEMPDRTPIPGKSAQLVAYGLLAVGTPARHAGE
jgi:hypothetical protein